MTSPLTLAVMSLKGGVGKTAITSNLATAWAMSHPDTYGLVLDFDPQQNLTMSLSSLVAGRGSATTEALLGEGLDNPEAALDPQAMTQVRAGEGRFDLLPAGNLANLERVEKALTVAPHGSWVLRNLLAGNGYDWIIIDTRPTSGNLSLNALAASTHAVGIVNPALWSIKGGTEIEHFVTNTNKTRISDTQYVGTIVNRVRGQKTDNQTMAIEALEASTENILHPYIPDGIAIPEGESLGQPAVSSNPKSAPAKALAQIADLLWSLRSAGIQAVAK
jgi:chromosome partitioning protein